MLYPDLWKYEDYFFGWYRMSTRKFDKLLDIMKNAQKKHTNFESLFHLKSNLL